MGGVNCSSSSLPVVTLTETNIKNYVPYNNKEEPWFSCKPDALVPPRCANEGPASEDDCPVMTLPQFLQKAATKSPDKPAMKVERPLPALGEDGKPPPALPDDQWQTWTYAKYLDDVKCAAKAAIKLGFKQHDSLNVWGFNAPEWMISALAANFAGGKVAGLYPTDTDDTAAYKVVHSGGSIVVVEDKGKLKKLASGLAARKEHGQPGDAKAVKAIIAYGFQPGPEEKQDLQGAGPVPVYGWNDFLAMGRGESDDALNERLSLVKPGHCAALIYTSGTTGDPKAVMISHDNLNYETSVVNRMLKQAVGFGADSTQERYLSYLPLSHVAGMMVDIVGPVILTANSSAWSTGYFARPYDLKVGAIKDRLQAARPTLFLGVPLVWEKIADKIRAIGAANTGAKKAIGDWAKGVNLDYSRGAQLGMQPGGAFGQTIAKKVMGKVKENLGLDQCKFGLTGAAPIRVDTLEYFGSLDLNINEIYGMSECTGATTFSLPQKHQWGSCGFEITGTEVKVFQVNEADLNSKQECPRAPNLDTREEQYQGEICFRGRHIMMGYLAQPALGDDHVKEIEKKTADCIDKDGWLHSGDKGMITVDGMCKITGRYKELIIGEGGENIAPIPIEDHVKKCCDGIAEIMMVGDKRKYNVALVTLKAVGANGEVPGTDALDAGAARINPSVKTITEARSDKVCIDAITAAITSANTNGKVCANNAAKIQKFTILPTNFSEQNNELTPTKKLKRKVVEEIYKDIIEKIYSTDGVYVPFE
jgi:long-chain-fatty-acid--CoA ligase ACSBG